MSKASKPQDPWKLLRRWLDLASSIGTSTTKVKEFAALRAQTLTALDLKKEIER